MTFKSLGLIAPVLRAIQELGYEEPTPIQQQAIPVLLKGNDLLGCAQTGTGKTAAFALPLIQQLTTDKPKGKSVIRCLILAPTRELAIQINDSIDAYRKYTHLRNTVIFGGVSQGPQTNTLKRGVDILVATPGRLLDLIGQGYISLKNVQYFVLDEADHMLDMGFIHDIRKVVAQLPPQAQRQSLFFSATMPPDILKLSHSILGQPEKITIKPQQATAERVDQCVYHVLKKTKRKLLLHLIREKQMDALLVFSRTKHGANRIVKELNKAKITAAAIHGNKTQGARQRALGAFREGDIKVLVATDIAARGIDISGLPYVINYDLPNVPETYVHRIGRTGRAEASGLAISFCDIEERPYLRDIEKLIQQSLPVIEDHPFVATEEEVAAAKVANAEKAANKRQGGGRPQRRRNKPSAGEKNKRKSKHRAKKEHAKSDQPSQEARQNNERKGNRPEKDQQENRQSKKNRNRGDNRNTESDGNRNDNNRKNSSKRRGRRSNDIGQRGMWPLG